MISSIESENQNITQWEAHTRFMSGRDVLQRYVTWFFGGKIGHIESIENDDEPIPKEDASIVPGNH
jgi:hypothetical protein